MDAVGTAGLATKLQRAVAEQRAARATWWRSLLDVSRIATGRFALGLEEFDIVESAGAASSTRCAHEPPHTAACDLSLDAPGPIVGAWDPLRLEQALTNLLVQRDQIRRRQADPGVGPPARRRGRRWRSATTVPASRRRELGRIFQRFERGRIDSQLWRPGSGPVSDPGDRARRTAGRSPRRTRPTAARASRSRLPLRAAVDAAETPTDTANVN